MCAVLLPPGGNPIAVNKYIDIITLGQAIPLQALDRSLGLQEVEDPRISRQSAHEDGRSSALRTGNLEGFVEVLINTASFFKVQVTFCVGNWCRVFLPKRRQSFIRLRDIISQKKKP
jgi:hypothetical protein